MSVSRNIDSRGGRVKGQVVKISRREAAGIDPRRHHIDRRLVGAVEVLADRLADEIADRSLIGGGQLLESLQVARGDAKTDLGVLDRRHLVERGWAEYPPGRLDPDNAITLCQEHHIARHRRGGDANE